ncbi:hypothetical protein [Nguyenibacter vanlangensis]|uniref:Uncharacterized protein n=1 Tax=Nguyenibacter vanlangensis TaxID=1216886 RepID=A0A7Y7ISX2_9PROT|nr:hypothetical protein [Nguyenibacter vanlangensis]NVN09708.1 hypothetical protein [Nguyenibacter vanlangensis]
MIRESTYTIEDDGADRGKVFIIRRMTAVEGDRWGRAFMHAATAALPEAEAKSVASLGIAGAAMSGAGMTILRNLDPKDAEPLLDTLLRCVEIQSDPTNPTTRVKYPLWLQQVEEVETIGAIQEQAFEFNTGFFKGVVRSISRMGQRTASDSQNTATSAP